MKIFSLEGSNGKAIVVQSSEISTLTSYDTEVARYDHLENKMEVYGWFSATTMRHINLFLEFHGFDKCTKKELIKIYGLTENI